jgi:hypothetical protein
MLTATVKVEPIDKVFGYVRFILVDGTKLTIAPEAALAGIAAYSIDPTIKRAMAKAIRDFLFILLGFIFSFSFHLIT